MAYGFVYIACNECMPDIYKIGFTNNPPMQRMEELSKSTSVPAEFKLVCYAEVDNAESLEKHMHDSFDEFRVSPNREFFRFVKRHLIEYVFCKLSMNAINFTQCEAYFKLEEEYKAWLESEQSSQTSGQTM